jgi:hypothetical protein
MDGVQHGGSRCGRPTLPSSQAKRLSCVAERIRANADQVQRLPQTVCQRQTSVSAVATGRAGVFRVGGNPRMTTVTAQLHRPRSTAHFAGRSLRLGPSSHPIADARGTARRHGTRPRISRNGWRGMGDLGYPERHVAGVPAIRACLSGVLPFRQLIRFKTLAIKRPIIHALAAAGKPHVFRDAVPRTRLPFVLSGSGSRGRERANSC